MSGSGVPRYARGSRAWGECGRSGRRMLLRDMVRDPLTDLLVDPAWAEPPLMRPATNIIDGVALIRPAPFLDRIGETIFVGNIVPLDGYIRPLVANYECGVPVISITVLPSGDYLLTEDGQQLLTEDGQPILIETAASDSLLTEDGQTILTEDGQDILVESAESVTTEGGDEVTTEDGETIVTE